MATRLSLSQTVNRVERERLAARRGAPSRGVRAMRATFRLSPQATPYRPEVLRRHNTHHAHIRVMTCAVCRTYGQMYVEPAGGGRP